MVVVDSSALIPLAWVGRLDLVATFDEVRTTVDVREEVLAGGKRGTAALDEFLETVAVHETPPEAERVASMEGIAVADASVLLLLADEEGGVLLANDKALVDVARTHDVEPWWVTTLLLDRTEGGTLTSDEATDLLYDLVDEGMNLHPKVYARIQRKLQEFDG